MYKFKPGDIVRLTKGVDEGYNSCTVKKVDSDGTLTLFRPYTHTGDFEYTGGVICYTGVEIYKASPENFVLVKAGPKLK